MLSNRLFGRPLTRIALENVTLGRQVQSSGHICFVKTCTNKLWFALHFSVPSRTQLSSVEQSLNQLELDHQGKVVEHTQNSSTNFAAQASPNHNNQDTMFAVRVLQGMKSQGLFVMLYPLPTRAAHEMMVPACQATQITVGHRVSHHRPLAFIRKCTISMRCSCYQAW